MFCVFGILLIFLQVVHVFILRDLSFQCDFNISSIKGLSYQLTEYISYLL